jgi:peptidoglycan/xylan/chitin deacetylase (PgdA/CDA1 family)
MNQLAGGRRLVVVAYHYVRDLPRTPFPRLNGLMLDAFRTQVTELQGRYEMSTLESALAFLNGSYRPSRDLCLLTFDDGLKEHHDEVLPELASRRLQGLFFPATACVNGRVAAVHKLHFLMAAVEFREYRTAFLRRLEEICPEVLTAERPPALLRKAYPWDDLHVAELKYIANYTLPSELCDQLLDDLFRRYLGDEAAFARELYVSWADLCEMQRYGMVIGGHSHSHVPLPRMSAEQKLGDLSRSLAILRCELQPQALWPFAYPYGQHDAETMAALQMLGVSCAFTVEPGVNAVGQNAYQLLRFDTNDLSRERPRRALAS